MACPFGAPRYSSARKVMTKCHLCHHRLEKGESPACVAACPTEALRYAAPGTLVPAGREAVPGFRDPAGCRPATRFLAPRGARREALLGALEERLRGTHER
jgi:hypothetical protein